MARRGTFAPLPCASAYCQKNFKKTMKNREKGLDIPLNIRYDNQVRVVEAFLRADTAMNREIAQVSEVTFGEYVRTSGG